MNPVPRKNPVPNKMPKKVSKNQASKTTAVKTSNPNNSSSSPKENTFNNQEVSRPPRNLPGNHNPSKMEEEVDIQNTEKNKDSNQSNQEKDISASTSNNENQIDTNTTSNPINTSTSIPIQNSSESDPQEMLSPRSKGSDSNLPKKSIIETITQKTRSFSNFLGNSFKKKNNEKGGEKSSPSLSSSSSSISDSSDSFSSKIEKSSISKLFYCVSMVKKRLIEFELFGNIGKPKTKLILK